MDWGRIPGRWGEVITGRKDEAAYRLLPIGQPLFQLCAAEPFLLAAVLNEGPKLVRMTQFDLLKVHPFNTDEQCNRLTLARDNDPVVLRVMDAGL